MRRRWKMFLFAATAALVASGRVDAQEVVLDRFLAGLTECRLSSDFERFYRGIVNRYGNEHGARVARVTPSATVPIPADIRPGVGRATSRTNGDSTVVVVPVRGLFRGLPTRHLEFTIGNENGIGIFAVEFAVPRPRVVSTFQEAIRAGNASIQRRGEPVGAVGFGRGTPSIWCDLST